MGRFVRPGGPCGESGADVGPGTPRKAQACCWAAKVSAAAVVACSSAAVSRATCCWSFLSCLLDGPGVAPECRSPVLLPLPEPALPADEPAEARLDGTVADGAVAIGEGDVADAEPVVPVESACSCAVSRSALADARSALAWVTARSRSSVFIVANFSPAVT